MLTSLVRAEIFKMALRAMPRIMLLILVAGVIALYGLLFLVLRTQPEGVQPTDIEELRDSLRVEGARASGLDTARTIGTILVIILGVSAISTEYSWGTIRTLLPRAGSRSAFLSAKLILVALWVALVVIVGFAAALLASVLFSALEGLATGVGGDFIPQSLVAIARTAFVMLPYASLSFLVAVWTRSTAAGIAIGLSVLFIEGLGVSLFRLLPGPLKEIPSALISQNVEAVVRANALEGDAFAESDANLPSAWRAAAVLAAYTAAFVALSYRRFLTRDVTSG